MILGMCVNNKMHKYLYVSAYYFTVIACREYKPLIGERIIRTTSKKHKPAFDEGTGDAYPGSSEGCRRKDATQSGKEQMMSEFSQIDIRVTPVYGEGGLSRAFPHLARLLKDYRYTLVLNEEPSLYAMVDVLIRVKNDPAVPETAKRAILQREREFVKVRDQAREQLLGRRLNELDRTLYVLEDLFKELEKELG